MTSKHGENGPELATPLPAIYSSTKQSLDYITVAGKSKRIGRQKRDLPTFCLEQLMENAADFMEKYYPGIADPTVTVSLIKQEIPSIGPTIRMSVRNPNEYSVPVFRNLPETLNPTTFFSDKRNIFRVGRGAQGDGLKNNLMIPYALWTDTTTSQKTEDSFGDKSWPVPLIFRHNCRESKVYLLVDRSNNESPITTDIVKGSPVDGNFTEIEGTIPITDDISDHLERDHFGVFRRQCLQFALFNTHLSFHFYFPDGRKLSLPARQPMSKNYSNPNSIDCYRPQEFKELIVTQHDRSMTLYDICKILFREGTNLVPGIELMTSHKKGPRRKES